jgi:hypothetical protein
MASEVVQITRRGFGQTMRRDAWWVQPLIVFIILGSFLVYATWAAFQNKYYAWGNYLSPFYSPLLFSDSPHAWLHGARPSWLPAFLPFSPALLILPFPAGFRLTCYYYRGAYYKSFWADPPNCAVGEPRKGYRGEKTLPLVIQNIHRYFLYAALVFLVILASDAYKAMWFFDRSAGREHFSEATHWAATRFGTWWAATSTSCRALPCARRPTTASAASIAATCAGPGSVCSGWRSPTSTFDS